MAPLPTALARNIAWGSNLSYAPIAVIVGGTSGIGEAMVEALHTYTKGRVHLIIVGRNKAAADAIFTRLQEGKGKANGGPATPDSQLEPATEFDGQWKREFIHAEVSLMANIRELTSKLRASLPRLNFLVLSAGYPSKTNERVETSEGLSHHLTLNYYSRFKIIQELLPLLRSASDAGQEAAATSVGVTTAYHDWLKPDPDDFGMTKSYARVRANLHLGVYSDYMLEELSIREPGITFTHAMPGYVKTPAVDHRYKHWLTGRFAWAIDLLITQANDCATWMWYGVLEGNGFNRRDAKGEAFGTRGYAGDPEMRRKLWEHSLEVTEP